MVAQRRAAGLDRVVQHRLDGIDQGLGAPVRLAEAVGDGRGLSLRGEPRAIQRLADIDVAKPSDHALVAERGLERGLLAGAGLRQHGGVEFIAKRLGPERRQLRLLLELGARHQLHRAETARIVEGHGGAVRHVKHHVVVRDGLCFLVMVSGDLALAAIAADAERARHAEMHHQHVARRQIGQQIFRAPPEPFDGLTFQALFEALRDRPAQAAMTHLDFLDCRAFHGRRQAATHGFDFGQFGHG